MIKAILFASTLFASSFAMAMNLNCKGAWNWISGGVAPAQLTFTQVDHDNFDLVLTINTHENFGKATRVKGAMFKFNLEEPTPVIGDVAGTLTLKFGYKDGIEDGFGVVVDGDKANGLFNCTSCK